MAHHVTRCPHCQTSFRVRDEHLKAAGGKVRCGSCLQVFNSKDHLISGPSTSDATTASATKTSPQANTPQPHTTKANSTRENTQAEQPHASNQSAGQTSTEQQNVVKPNSRSNAQTSTPVSPAGTAVSASAASDEHAQVDLGSQQEVDADSLFDSLFGSDVSGSLEGDLPAFDPDSPATTALTETETSSSDDDDDFLIHDDMELEEEASSANTAEPDDQLYDEDPYDDYNLRSPEQAHRPKPGSSLDIDESLLNLDDLDGDALSYEDLEEHLDFEADESWAAALIEEDDMPAELKSQLGLDDGNDGSGSEPAARTSAASSSEQPSKAASEPGTTSSDAETSATSSQSSGGIQFALAEDDSDHDDQPSDTATAFPRARHEELTGDLQPEPLALVKASDSRASVMWSIGSVCLLVMLAAQVLYTHFDDWARQPEWRPVYSQICSVTGCELPSIQNVARMTTRNLVVRSHPELENALVVDVLMLNIESHAQPFPDLALSFRDINDNTVASRTFQPKEYLSGEVAGRTVMPSKTPIHIALEIIDPGPEAVSYAVNLVGNR